jgi:hypothetical protein
MTPNEEQELLERLKRIEVAAIDQRSVRWSWALAGLLFFAGVIAGWLLGSWRAPQATRAFTAEDIKTIATALKDATAEQAGGGAGKAGSGGRAGNAGAGGHR